MTLLAGPEAEAGAAYDNDHAPAVANIPPRPASLDSGRWRARAACSGTDPDQWVDLPAAFRNGRPNPAYAAAAHRLKMSCTGCPVRAHCLWTALDNDAEGVFGGTDDFDRDEIRAALNLSRAGGGSGAPVPDRAADAGHGQSAEASSRLLGPENEDVGSEEAQRKAQAVRLMVFRGSTAREAADQVGLSLASVYRILAP